MSREVHMSIMWIETREKYEIWPGTVALNAERGDVLLLYAGGRRVDVDLGANHPFVAFPPDAIAGNRLRIERGTAVRIMAKLRSRGQKPYRLHKKVNPPEEQPSGSPLTAKPGEPTVDHGDIIFDP